jgi:HSP20 family protein
MWAELKKEEIQKDVTYHIRESRYEPFSRSIPLPIHVISEKAKAEFENGILTLELPNADEAK